MFAGRQLYELSSKKQELLEKLESNQKELQEAQELAATQPGSVNGMYIVISHTVATAFSICP